MGVAGVGLIFEYGFYDFDCQGRSLGLFTRVY
jgi:hypothetical protein